MTFGNLAGITSTAALVGLQTGESGLGLQTASTRSELEASAIGKIAEINIIQPKSNNTGIGLLNQEKKGIGLNRQQYNALGQVGLMTAVKRAGGSSLAGLTGSILNKTI